MSDIYSQYAWKQVEEAGLPAMRDPITQEQRDREREADKILYKDVLKMLRWTHEDLQEAQGSYGFPKAFGRTLGRRASSLRPRSGIRRRDEESNRSDS